MQSPRGPRRTDPAEQGGAPGTSKEVRSLPRIDGTDELSRRAMALLEQGHPLADLEALGLSKDQAKKLSRLRALLAAARPHLTASAVGKLQGLGLRAVALAPMVQAEDWPGLEEVLQSVDLATVKRADLEKAPALLAEKRARVAEVEQQMKHRLAYLERQRDQLQQEEEALRRLEQQIDRALNFLAPYTEPVREFLTEHLGVDAVGRLVLARRLDYPWQNSLKRKGVLRYDPEGMVWLVVDLDALAKGVEHRLKRGHPVRYDPARVPDSPFRRGPVPESARYRLATGLAVDLRAARDHQRQRLAEIREQMAAAEKEIKEIRHRSPQSFLEAVQATNTLSDRDLETHGRLQAAALRWLYDQGYVATAELVVGTRRWDVAGYDQAGLVTIVEAKASLQDFRRDDKWREYLPYADRFYFVVEEQFIDAYGTPAANVGWLAVNRAGHVRVVQECPGHQVAREREATAWAIARALTRRMVFGF